MAMAKYMEKLQVVKNIVKHNNGLVGTFLAVFRRDDAGFKWGNCVGEDKYGNRYFQNNHYFIGRSRWVEFPLSVGHDYDATQVPPEWHRWLQYIGDDIPTAENMPRRKWMSDNYENLSGTPHEYVPYSTTKPKIEAWVPPSK